MQKITWNNFFARKDRHKSSSKNGIASKFQSDYEKINFVIKYNINNL
jgi:hypothetical protein